MSIRTIVEINHDYIRTHDGSNGRSGEIPGIKFIAQRHHSEKVKLTVE